jgi:chromosome segregation ATPase
VQYLAEVQKKSGVFGGGKAELKLLACQRGESWTAVPGEEVIPADELSNLGAGVLVFAEVNANKQLQGTPKEASRQLVSMLQNHSRLQEKTKTQEEEIEQWKQSLTFQSQELNRREMEMQAQLEQFEQLQNEIEQLESKRGEIDVSNQEVEQLRSELEQKQREIDEAWAQLQSQQAEAPNIEGGDTSYGGVLDPEQTNALIEWLNYLEQVVAPTEAVQEPLNVTWEQVTAQQAILDEHWQQLEQQRGSAEQQQSDLDREAQELEAQWQQLSQSGESGGQTGMNVQVQQNTLDLKQQWAAALRSQIQTQEAVAQQISQLSSSSPTGAESTSSSSGDLENISLRDLHRAVRRLRQELSENFPFISDQEEELTLQVEEIDELKGKMKGKFGDERQELEHELADQEESFKFLNQTLVGQWRSLMERERIVNQHQTTLWRRLGNPEISSSEGGGSAAVNVAPLVAQLEELRQQQQQALEQVEAEIAQLQQSLEQAPAQDAQPEGDREGQLQALKQQEQALSARRAEVAQLWGRVNLYQELLQPVQDRLNDLRTNLEAALAGVAQVQEMGDSQRQAIAQLQSIVAGLTGAA